MELMHVTCVSSHETPNVQMKHADGNDGMCDLQMLQHIGCS